MYISQSERMKLAKQGKALPDGSYPIRNRKDLENAIQAFGRAKDKAQTKTFICKRAKELDAENLLPEDWSTSLEKAKKGTPEYDKWLEQYRAKRGKKQQDSSVEAKKTLEKPKHELTKEGLKSFVNKVTKITTRVHGDDTSFYADIECLSDRQTESVKRKAVEAGYEVSSEPRVGVKGSWVRVAKPDSGVQRLRGEKQEIHTERKPLDNKEAHRIFFAAEVPTRKYKAAEAQVYNKYQSFRRSAQNKLTRQIESQNLQDGTPEYDKIFDEFDATLNAKYKELEDQYNLQSLESDMVQALDKVAEAAGYEIVKNEGELVHSYKFDGKQVGQHEMMKQFASDYLGLKKAQEYDNFYEPLEQAVEEAFFEKAKKGTPEYEEWLRKYREKRQKGVEKPEEKKPRSFANTLKEMVAKKESYTQSDLFAQQEAATETLKEQETEQKNELFEKYGLNNLVEPEKESYPSKEQEPEIATTHEDVRAITQMNRDIVSAELSPELLKATASPVFANLFGHYPVEPLVYQNRMVTSDVEEIDVALAEEPDEISQEVLDDPEWIPTEKVDGVRATLICTPEATRITGRRQQANVGKKKPTDYTNNLPHIRDLDLYAILGDTVLDSEAVASNPIEVEKGKWGDSLASTMSVLGQEKDLNVCVQRMNEFGPILAYAFDIQRYNGSDVRLLPYVERMKFLDEAIAKIHDTYGSGYIKRVNQQRQDETKKQFFERVTTIGGEGLVLAKADGPYKAFDRKNRLKMKRRVELTLQVMSIEEGVGRNKGQAGAFVMGAYINGILTPVCNLNVGSDALRQDVWQNQDKYLGRAVETVAMKWTLGSGKQGQPRLRHARWKTPGMFREDKVTPDDVSRTIEFLKRKRDTGK